MLKIFASEEPPGRGLISHRPAVLIPAALRLFARRHPVAHYQRDLRFEAIEKRGIKYLFTYAQMRGIQDNFPFGMTYAIVKRI